MKATWMNTPALRTIGVSNDTYKRIRAWQAIFTVQNQEVPTLGRTIDLLLDIADAHEQSQVAKWS